MYQELQFLILTLILSIFKAEDPVITNKFIARERCKSRILGEFERYSIFESRTNLECAEHCSRDIYCISYNYLPTIKQCHLNKGFIDENCTNSMVVPESLYYEKVEYVCLHGGSFNSTALACDCKDGYIGKNCERVMKDCHEGANQPYYAGMLDMFYVFPDTAPKPFKIMCRMMWGGRTIVMQHYNPNIIYNMTWQQYKTGFVDTGDLTNWIGLDNLHHLTTSKRYRVYIELNDKARKMYLLNSYDNFKIGNESSGYRLISVGNPVSLELPSCLPDLVGSSFSTYDNDLDKNATINCASVYGVGWWFNEQFCTKCNPMGKLNNPPGGNWNTIPSYVFWSGQTWSPFTTKIFLVLY